MEDLPLLVGDLEDLTLVVELVVVVHQMLLVLLELMRLVVEVERETIILFMLMEVPVVPAS